MSGTINQRVSRVVIIIIAVSDIFIALGFLIKASFDKNQKYKYIENETEWNSLYVSLIITGVLVLYGLFRPNPRCVLISLAIKVFAMLCITYAVIRGKLENIRCERELCRFSEVCLCFERKNKFEYEYTPKWLTLEIAAIIAHVCLSSQKPKNKSKSRVHHPFITTTSTTV